MSSVPEIVRAHEGEIVRVLKEKLPHAECPTLAKSSAGQPEILVATLTACFGDAAAMAARDWARAVAYETGSKGVCGSEVLAALSCLEQVVRYHVVRSIHQKKTLIPALADLADAIERLRRCSTEFQLAPLSDGSLETDTGTAVDRDRAEDFVALADADPAFICLTDLHGKPFYMNRAGREMVGLGSQDELAPSLHKYHSEDSWKQLRDIVVPAVKQEGQWEGKAQVRNQQSDEFVEVATAVYLLRSRAGDRRSCLAVTHRLLRGEAAVEEALAEAEARKNAILESSLDPIITINHEGVITEFNRAAEQTFGHRREDVLGTEPSEVLFPPMASAGHQNRIDRYLAAGEGSMLGKRAEVTAVRASGETFPAEIAMTISQEQGAPVLTFFVRDISERKKAEEEQARYSAELERSNRELEQFAYVASHDLQEPLRKIRTFSDRLEVKCGDQLDDTGHECVQRMQSAATRMQALIEGLLTLSRVTTRAQDFVPVDLATVAQDVVSDLEIPIEQAEGRVEVGKLPTIQADPLQMRQLLQNLIGNALKFRRADVPPEVKVHGRFVQDRSQREPGKSPVDERCRIVVEDNGIGFDERYADRIFGVFQRLHPRDVYEGTGVGLAICRRIVERHGGTITAHSVPEKGTTFEVMLPAIHPKSKK